MPVLKKPIHLALSVILVAAFVAASRPAVSSEFFTEYYVNEDQAPDTISNGSASAPFSSIEQARDAIRAFIRQDRLPDGGITVWIYGGVYELSQTLHFEEQDSGTTDKPIVYKAVPETGEVRLIGGRILDLDSEPSPATNDSVINRIPAASQSHIEQINLADLGIKDYGEWSQRGYATNNLAPLEFFYNRNPMQVAHWPDNNQNDPLQSSFNNEIEVFNKNCQPAPSPNITGIYEKASQDSDGINIYKRRGLLQKRQYYLYRRQAPSGIYYWQIATTTSGHPQQSGDPYWTLEAENLNNQSTFFANSNSGASGHVSLNKPDRVHQGFALIDQCTGATPNSFGYSSERVSQWENNQNIWIRGFWRNLYADRLLPAVQIDRTQRTITLVESPPPSQSDNLGQGFPYQVFNLPEEITTPGEYYLDHNTGTLYFYPPSDQNNNIATELAVSLTHDPLLKLTHTRHLTFDGLTVEMSRGDLVVIQGGSDNQLINCTIRNAGRHGAIISGNHNGLENCEIHNTGDKGVQLNGGSFTGLQPGNNYVNDSKIHHFGRWSWSYAPAITMYGVGLTASHNHIHHGPGVGIILFGNNNTVSFNEIDHVAQYAGDMGAIYAGVNNWNQWGLQILNNHIHDINSKFNGLQLNQTTAVHGIYLDAGFSGSTIQNNVFENVHDAAVLVNGGRNNIVQNNKFINNGTAFLMTNVLVKYASSIPGNNYNIVERTSARPYQNKVWTLNYPDLAAIPDNWTAILEQPHWLWPEGNIFSNNKGYGNGIWIDQNTHS